MTGLLFAAALFVAPLAGAIPLAATAPASLTVSVIAARLACMTEVMSTKVVGTKLQSSG